MNQNREDYDRHRNLFLEMALNHYEHLLEFTSRADREIITRNAFDKSEYACKILQIVPNGVKEIYDYVWSDEVTRCWDSLYSKKEEVGKYWIYYNRAMRGAGWILLKPVERSKNSLEIEVREEFREMYEARVKKGLIR